MTEHLSADLFVEEMQACFERGQEVTFIPSGRSMLPTINGSSDKVTLKAIDAPLKKRDIILYRRSGGELVLHRIVGFRQDGSLILCGDNQYDYEYGVMPDDVLARMIRRDRNGRETAVDSVSFRFSSSLLIARKRVLRAARRVVARFRAAG